MFEYAALVASPRALPDGLILVFQHPVKALFPFPGSIRKNMPFRRVAIEDFHPLLNHLAFLC